MFEHIQEVPYSFSFTDQSKDSYFNTLFDYHVTTEKTEMLYE